MVVVNALFNSATTFVWDALDVVLPELYETKVRASANGFLTGTFHFFPLHEQPIMALFLTDGWSRALFDLLVPREASRGKRGTIFITVGRRR